MPEITKEEELLLASAKLFCEKHRGGGAALSWATMLEAYDALPKPYVPLLSEEDVASLRVARWSTEWDTRNVTIVTLRRAADRLETDGSSVDGIATLRELADEEEKCNA